MELLTTRWRTPRCCLARRVSHEPPAVRVVLHDPGMTTTHNFIACDRDQELLLPPSLKDWLPNDHLAWFVLDAVDELDLSEFYASYRADGWGGRSARPEDDGGALHIRVLDRGPLGARDRAPLHRG